MFSESKLFEEQIIQIADTDDARHLEVSLDLGCQAVHRTEGLHEVHETLVCNLYMGGSGGVGEGGGGCGGGIGRKGREVSCVCMFVCVCVHVRMCVHVACVHVVCAQTLLAGSG